MRNIGITQRVHFIKEYNEYRDELDQRWSSLFANIGILQIILPNNSELFKSKAISSNATTELLSQPLVMEASEALKVQATDANELHVIASILEIEPREVTT